MSVKDVGSKIVASDKFMVKVVVLSCISNRRFRLYIHTSFFFLTHSSGFLCGRTPPAIVMMATTGTDDDHGDNGDNDRGREGQDVPMQGDGTRPDDAIEIGEDDDDDVDDDKGGVRVDKGEPGDPPPAGGDSGGNNHNKSDVDEIDDVIDDDYTGKVHLPCRPHRLGCMLDPSPSPIKLFATKQDEELRQERLHHPNGSPPSGATNWQQQQQQEQEQHWSFVHCWTFREMMGLDRMWGPMNGGGIDFVVIGTYILDVDFLLAELPELLDVPVVVVLYQYKDPSLDGSEIAWQAHVDRRRRAGHTATLVMLERNPRADPNGGGGGPRGCQPIVCSDGIWLSPCEVRVGWIPVPTAKSRYSHVEPTTAGRPPQMPGRVHPRLPPQDGGPNVFLRHFGL